MATFDWNRMMFRHQWCWLKRVRYRDHRGGLDESLATQQELTEPQLRQHLRQLHGEVKTLELVPCGFDARTGWDTYYVVMNGSCVGMTDGTFKK